MEKSLNILNVTKGTSAICLVDVENIDNLLKEPQWCMEIVNRAVSDNTIEILNGDTVSLNVIGRPESKVTFLITFNEEEIDDPKTCTFNDKKNLWNQNACHLLINNRHDLDHEFNSGLKHVKIWRKVAERLNENGVLVTAQECNDKWRNLMQTFRKNVQKANSSGEETVNWPYFNMMYQYFGKKDSVNPPQKNLCQSSLGLEESTKLVPKNCDISDDNCDDNNLKHFSSLNKKRKVNPIEQIVELVKEETKAREKMDSTLTEFLESMLDIEKQKLALKKKKFSS